MPLLPREPDIFPDDLFGMDLSRHPWCVAHVRSRQEKVLARWLLERKIAFFAPQTEKRRRRAERDFKSYIPLFAGYVFFRGDRVAREGVWRSGVIANIIDVDDQELLDRELRQIHELLLAGASLRPHVEFARGEAVRIVEGAFEGYTGVVLREKGHDRLIVSLSLLQRALVAEFARDLLARAR